MISFQPDFIIIGTQKGGTTSLYNYLIQHPKIVPATEKEVHFFDLQYQQGIEWYEAQFAAKNTPSLLTGEASPYYIFHPLVPQRLKQHYPNVKIIVLLRNPVDRTISHYYHEIRLNFETLSLEAALDAETERLAGETEKILNEGTYYSFNHQHYTYLSRSIYVDQLIHWMQYFPREQFLILESETFYQQPESTVNQAFEFLGLPAHQLPQYSKYNSGDYPPVSDRISQHLINYFRPHNQRLTAYLGQEFTWKTYDRTNGKNRLRGRLGQLRTILDKFNRPKTHR